MTEKKVNQPGADQFKLISEFWSNGVMVAKLDLSLHHSNTQVLHDR